MRTTVLSMLNSLVVIGINGLGLTTCIGEGAKMRSNIPKTISSVSAAFTELRAF